MKIAIKRVYQPVDPDDGLRVLVDRLWPRGLSKADAKIDIWAKEIAPSTDLRRWFHSDEANWTEFKRRYGAELVSHESEVRALRKEIGRRKATLLYGTRDEAHNHAQLVARYMESLGAGAK